MGTIFPVTECPISSLLQVIGEVSDFFHVWWDPQFWRQFLDICLAMLPGVSYGDRVQMGLKSQIHISPILLTQERSKILASLMLFKMSVQNLHFASL